MPSRRTIGSDRIAATDPASANLGRVIASFAMSHLGRCAKGVPRKWRATHTENSRQLRRPLPAIVRQNSLDKPFASGTHLAHETPSEDQSARRSEKTSIDEANQSPQNDASQLADQKYLGAASRPAIFVFLYQNAKKATAAGPLVELGGLAATNLTTVESLVGARLAVSY